MSAPVAVLDRGDEPVVVELYRLGDARELLDLALELLDVYDGELRLQPASRTSARRGFTQMPRSVTITSTVSPGVVIVVTLF